MFIVESNNPDFSEAVLQSVSHEIESMVNVVSEFGLIISKGKNGNPGVETIALPTDLKCKSLYIVILLALLSTYFLFIQQNLYLQNLKFQLYSFYSCYSC